LSTLDVVIVVITLPTAKQTGNNMRQVQAKTEAENMINRVCTTYGQVS